MNSRAVLDLAAAALCATLAVSVGALAVKTYAVLDSVQATTQALPGALDAAITREAARLDGKLESVDKLARTLDEVVRVRTASLQRDLVREIQQTRLTTLKLIDEHGIQLQELADQRSAELLLTADAHLGAANSAVARLTDAYAAVPAAIGARLDPWTDCRRGTCLQAQTLGMIGTFRATGAEAARVGRVAREAAPSIVRDFGQTTANVERITRPEGWKWKALRLLAPFAAGYAAGQR